MHTYGVPDLMRCATGAASHGVEGAAGWAWEVSGGKASGAEPVQTGFENTSHAPDPA